jgi:hypothetical protein
MLLSYRIRLQPPQGKHPALQNMKFLYFFPVLGIRIRMFLGLQDPDPDPLVRGADPDPAPSLLLSKKSYKKKYRNNFFFASLKSLRKEV